MQDSKLMQREHNSPLKDVQSRSISTNDLCTNSNSLNSRITGKQEPSSNSGKENIRPDQNRTRQNSLVPDPVMETIMSQECLQTQVNMVSRCLK